MRLACRRTISRIDRSAAFGSNEAESERGRLALAALYGFDHSQVVSKRPMLGELVTFDGEDVEL